jgi:hypothetical protein
MTQFSSVFWGSWSASVFLCIVAQSRSVILKFVAPHRHFFSAAKSSGRKHSLTCDESRFDSLLPLADIWPQRGLQMRNNFQLHWPICSLAKLRHGWRTTLARLLLLYPQVTSRCRTQAICNKHLLHILEDIYLKTQFVFPSKVRLCITFTLNKTR